MVKNKIIVFLLASVFGSTAFGYEGIVPNTSSGSYEGPSPLQGIKIAASISVDSQGRYRYAYTVTNPSSNDSQIADVTFFLPWNPAKEVSLATAGFTHCKGHSGGSGEQWILQKRPMVPVGSEAPKGWSCNYENLAGFSDGAFSFGGIDDPYFVNPGSSLRMTIISAGLPAIRTVLIEPYIDTDLLPEEFNLGNKLELLHEKVRWTGKGIGPKAPPKVFDASAFIAYLISLKEQSRVEGWIDNDGISNGLGAKLNDAQKKITAGDTKTAKNVLGAFLNDVQAQNGKHLTSEAYALLYFNGKYLADHL